MNTAVSNANRLLSDAVADLQSNPSGTSKYTKWFGTYTKDRLRTVNTVLRVVKGKPSGAKYLCRPNERGVWGWSYGKSYPDQIYLGSAFFKSGASLVNRATTLIHELSHGYARTKDKGDSIQNAYSYEGFCSEFR